MWRYRWIALAVVWLVCIGGWAWVYLMKDVYVANARVYVDTENAIEDILGGIASPTDVTSEVSLVVREIVSRPNLAEVARNTDLALRARTENEFQNLLTSLRNRVRVNGNRDGEYSISFRDNNRDTALAVVETLLATFVERSLGADRTDTAQAQSFLQAQIADYERRLTEAEDRLAAFKRENVSFMPGQRGDYFSRLQSTELRLQETESKLRLAEERRSELVRQIEGEEPVFGIMPTSPTSASGQSTGSSAKIHELEAELDELLLQYTDRHPRVGALRDTIEMLKEQEAEEQLRRSMQGTGSGLASQNPLDLNPVYQRMRIQLSDADVEIASLRAERSQYRAEVAQLKEQVDTIPQVEAQLNRLNRDYDVIRAKHQQLLHQLETASIGEDVSQSIDEIQFRIIDPPFSDFRPVGPNRPMLLTIVSVVGVGLAIALAFVLNQLNPTFVGYRSITEVLGIPVLAAVSLLQSDEEMRAEKRGRYALQAMTFLLLLSFLGAVTFSSEGSTALRQLVASVS
jgi:polysaccharide chain length determinant protein (PEP-CTERM system associated)